MPMLLSLMLAVGAAAPAPMPPPPPPCEGQISLALDTEDGAFNGMSHSGALLVVRNIGPGACTIGTLPTLRFEDAAGRALPIARAAPAATRLPAPAPTIVIAGGAEATAPLRWVSGDVYGAGACLTPARLVFGRGPGQRAVPFGFNLCGPAGKTIPFEQPALKTDPVFRPPRRGAGAR